MTSSVSRKIFTFRGGKARRRIGGNCQVFTLNRGARRLPVVRVLFEPFAKISGQ